MLVFEQICKDNYEKIYKYVWTMIANKSQAEDITQEVFLIAFQKGERFLKHEKPEAFLYRTAKNLVLQYSRQEKRENKMQLEETLLAGPEEDILEFLCREHDSNICVEDYIPIILSQLSKEKKQLYTDYYINHKTMDVIAKEKNISYSALRMQYVRLRRELKAIVEQLQLSEI